MDATELQSKVKQLEDHKQRKLTKAEKTDLISNFVAEYTEQKLHDGKILNMMQGFELANKMILDYINNGKNIDDVKNFIEKNLSPSGKEAMNKVVQSKTVVNEESN